MAIKDLYDKAMAIAGWFSPRAKVEGWLDDEFGPAAAASTTFFENRTDAIERGQKVATALQLGGVLVE